MKTKLYSLDMKEPVKWAEIVQLIFGILCISVSVFLLISLLKVDKTEASSLTGVGFVVLFGVYQIWAGLGYTRKFIEIDENLIRLKINPVTKIRNLLFSDLDKIEVFPLNIILRLKDSSKINLRFGTYNPERNEDIIDELSRFAERNSISFELKSGQ